MGVGRIVGDAQVCQSVVESVVVPVIDHESRSSVRDPTREVFRLSINVNLGATSSNRNCPLPRPHDLPGLVADQDSDTTFVGSDKGDTLVPVCDLNLLQLSLRARFVLCFLLLDVRHDLLRCMLGCLQGGFFGCILQL